MLVIKSNKVKNYLKSNVRELLAMLARGGTVLPIVAGPARGLRVPKDVGLANLSILLGLYERAVTLAILGVERPIQVAYDIGAHVGLTILILARAFGHNCKIIAFEPLRENASSLEALILANPGLDVTIIPVALAQANGEAKFLRSQTASMGMLSTVAVGDQKSVQDGDCDLIRTLTLDSFVFDEGHSPPDFMKIDVEGAESLVIAGGLRTIERYRPILLFELHGPKHAAEVWDLLLGHSYQWKYIDPEAGPSETIADRSQFLAYFGSGDRWTQHVILR